METIPKDLRLLVAQKAHLSWVKWYSNKPKVRYRIGINYTGRQVLGENGVTLFNPQMHVAYQMIRMVELRRKNRQIYEHYFDVVWDAF